MASPAAAAAQLGNALREATRSAGIMQKQIAEAVGRDQSTVSAWLSGDSWAPLWALPIIDELCRQKAGHILRLAGFVDPEIDLETAIETAPAPIDATDRQALLLLYRTFAVRHMGNGPVMPSPRTPGMTAAEEKLREATAEQARRDAAARPEAG